MEYGLIKDTTLQTMADGFREKGIVPKTDPVYEQLDYIKYASANATSLDDPTPVDTSGGDTTYETIDVSIPEATSLEFVFHIGYYSINKAVAGYLRVRSNNSNAFSEGITGSGGSRTITARIDPHYGNTMQVRLEPTAAALTAFAVTFEVYPLDADGNYMQIAREVGVSTHKVTPEEMAEAITNFDIPIAPPEEALTITGDCLNKFSGDGWNWFLDTYKDALTTKDITNADSMFKENDTLKEIPFDLNIADSCSITSIFENAFQLEKVPYIYGKPSTFYRVFCGTRLIREIPEDWADNLDFSVINSSTSNGCSYVFNGCYSLKRIPSSLLQKLWSNGTTSNCVPYYNLFNTCRLLEKANELGVQRSTLTTNRCSYTFSNCNRLKSFTFAVQPDGTPYTASWKAQTLDLSDRVGYAQYKTYITDYVTEEEIAKEVIDDATYQALKNDPDWWTTNILYSRYNHDSAVETINSLPDTSAYLASGGGTNTIRFARNSGYNTDGGHCGALTAEEIAVAAAKGWTVTLV